MSMDDTAIPDSFFEKCAFVSIDIQEEERKKPHTDDSTLFADWAKRGFTYQDVNAAQDYLYDVARPNAEKAAAACRKFGLPMILVHWGYAFEDGMDLEPKTRQGFVQMWGNDYSKWMGHSRAKAKPASLFNIQKSDYVIAKTAQDAFPSSCFPYVLQNLGITNIIFVGGHTGGCLGGTARSAKNAGYTMLCVEDATFDARESRRLPNLRASNFDYVVSAEQLLARMQKLSPKNSARGTA
jgi:nicotinamidase-related amidase